MEFTGITENNRIFFAHLAPKELLGKAGSYGFFGIGAAVGQRPELRGEAVILFHVTNDTEGERYVSVDWIYVGEDLQRQGIGTALLTEMEKCMTGDNIESICVDLPAKGHEEIKGLLRKAGYQEALMRLPFYVFPVKKEKEITRNQSGAEHKGMLIPLIDAEMGEIKRAAKKLYNERNMRNTRVVFSQPVDYFDSDVSFVHTVKGETDGWILVKKERAGVLTIVSYEGIGDAGFGTMRELFLECVEAIRYKYGSKAILQIPIQSEEELEYLEQYISIDMQRIAERFVKPLTEG